MAGGAGDDRFGVAIIGYGYAGRCFHSYLVRRCAALRLVGIASQRQAARAEIAATLGVRAYGGLAEALDDPAVQLVVVATPNDLHAPQAIAALEAGKHVVVEKPMALDVASADAMLAASRHSGRLLTVFHNRRWDGDYLTIQRLIAEGWLGKPFYFELFWGRATPVRGWRALAAHGGGRLWDLGVHMIDQALQLVAAPLRQVHCRARADLLDTEVDDHALCLLSFADRTEVHITASSLAHRPKPRWYIMGTAGTLVKEGLDPQEQAMVSGDIDAAREPPEHYARLTVAAAGQPAEFAVPTVAGRWRSFYENVAAALRGEAPVAVTPESARLPVVVLAAARRSATEGRPVDIEEATPA